MSELRKDPITNSWIIIASERSKRPFDHNQLENSAAAEPVKCPFCVGSENMTPNEIFSYRPPDDKTKWWVRGFPALSPILKIEGELDQRGFGIYDTVNGIGAHEIIVESPKHGEDFSEMDTNQIEKVFWAYRDRIIDLKRDKRFRYIMIFKNHGPQSGASNIKHPHSQVIALPATPKKIKEELDGAKFHYGLKERCIFCDVISQEIQIDERIIMKTEHFAVLAPWAPRFPYETWILPLKHSHDFTSISKEQIIDLSFVYKKFFKALYKVLGEDISYNMILHDAPNLLRREGYWKTIEDDFHWHIEVIPRVTRIAGFEWGTGFYINSIPPEHAAKEMKKIIYQ